MGTAFDKTKAAEAFLKKITSKSDASSTYYSWLNRTVSNNSQSINKIQGTANAISAAYKYIGQIPFLSIRHSSV